MKELVDGNPVLRRKLYAIYGVTGVLLGSAVVGFAEAGQSAPTWLGVAVAVHLYLGGAFGFGARSKVDAVPVVELSREDVEA